MIDQLFQMINSTNIGIMLGVGGILVAIWTYLKTRELRRLHYKIKNVNIVGGPNPEFESRVEIRCDGQVIPRVTKTTVSFWNSGNRTIRNVDIPRVDPMRISLPKGTQIIELEILSQTTPANMAHIANIRDDGAVPGFEFLDPKQGFAFEVLHTALSDDVKVEGTIIGIGNPTLWDTKNAKSAIFVLASMLSLYITFAIIAIAVSVWLTKELELGGWVQTLAFLSGIVCSLVASMLFQDKFIAYTERRGMPSHLVS